MRTQVVLDAREIATATYELLAKRGFRMVGNPVIDARGSVTITCEVEVMAADKASPEQTEPKEGT